MDDFSLCSLNICADKSYDSNKNFDFVHDSFKGRAFISKRSFPLSAKSPTGKCDSVLKVHSTYLEKKRNILKTRFVCPLFNSKSNSADCPFKNVYRFRHNVENLFSIASDGRLDRFNDYSINYVNTKARLFDLFALVSASLVVYLIEKICSFLPSESGIFSLPDFCLYLSLMLSPVNFQDFHRLFFPFSHYFSFNDLLFSLLSYFFLSLTAIYLAGEYAFLLISLFFLFRRP